MSLYGLVAVAREWVAWNRAVAISCMVRVILRMLRTALRRLTSTLLLAIDGFPRSVSGDQVISLLCPNGS